jgi:CheY-like chemotaxis protein
MKSRPIRESLPPATATTTEPSRGTIVVADDDPATLMLLCQVLSKAHFTVRACENGKLACEAVREQQPDVLLIDWMMPVMDGQTAVGELKADPKTRGIPIIMVTPRKRTCLNESSRWKPAFRIS